MTCLRLKPTAPTSIIAAPISSTPYQGVPVPVFGSYPGIVGVPTAGEVTIAGGVTTGVVTGMIAQIPFMMVLWSSVTAPFRATTVLAPSHR